MTASVPQGRFGARLVKAAPLARIATMGVQSNFATTQSMPIRIRARHRISITNGTGKNISLGKLSPILEYKPRFVLRYSVGPRSLCLSQSLIFRQMQSPILRVPGKLPRQGVSPQRLQSGVKTGMRVISQISHIAMLKRIVQQVI